MNVSCQCGAVAFQTPTKEPLELYICHCQDCRKQYVSSSSSSSYASTIRSLFVHEFQRDETGGKDFDDMLTTPGIYNRSSSAFGCSAIFPIFALPSPEKLECYTCVLLSISLFHQNIFTDHYSGKAPKTASITPHSAISAALVVHGCCMSSRGEILLVSRVVVSKVSIGRRRSIFGVVLLVCLPLHPIPHLRHQKHPSPLSRLS